MPAAPITRSTWLPHHSRISRLKPRWTSPEWTSVAVSGVRKAGTAGIGHAGTREPERDEAERISRLRRTGRATAAITHASAVSATMMLVAVRGKRCTPQMNSILADLVIAVARRGRDLDLLALLAADERAAERRIVADPPHLRVRFGLADELVLHLLLVLVDQRDGRAEHDLVARQRGRIDHHRSAEAVLEVGDHRLDLALALLRRMIFGVLAEIAVRARFLDRLDDRRTLQAQPLAARSSSWRWPSASIGTFSTVAIVKNPFSKSCPGVPPGPRTKANCQWKPSSGRRNNRIGATRLQARGPEPPRSPARRRGWRAPW